MRFSRTNSIFIDLFIFENLVIYAKGSEILEKGFDEKFDGVPILSGDFNINFADYKNPS